MTRPRRPPWWGWLPLAVGAATGVALELAVPDRRVYVSVAPALLAVLAGIALTAGIVLVQARLRSGRAREQAREQALVHRTQALADDSRRRFVRRLDHELKNPLTALLTALSGPQEDWHPGSRQVARAQADRLRRLLTDLRRVADVETVHLDLAPVDVAQLLQEAVDSAVADAGGERAVRVDVPSAPWPVPDVRGDADLLLVAVYNVVANALKYSRPEDAVEVRAREVGGPYPRVLVEVADTGPGIAPDEQALVWEELARGRAGAGRPGSGIGLALVRVIVDRHGGSVALHSRTGAGTSVQLYLPTG